MNEIQMNPPTSQELQAAHDSFMSYLRNNPNNFSYWYPHIKGLDNHGISIPKSIFTPIPEEIYKSFFRENEGDDERIDNWVINYLIPLIERVPWLKNHKIFIKNGCFSNKFDFANGCLIADPNDEETLIKNICNIQANSIMHETDGYLELVLREFIEPSKADTPTIYNGMPLRPEVRIFYDFDRHQYLYDVNYWDWDECHGPICFGWDGERTPDADAYEKTWPYLLFATKHLLEKHLTLITDALSTVTTLTMPDGQPNIWSVDFILEDDRVWLIDMAQGWRSAYWDPKKVNSILNK